MQTAEYDEVKQGLGVFDEVCEDLGISSIGLRLSRTPTTEQVIGTYKATNSVHIYHLIITSQRFICLRKESLMLKDTVLMSLFNTMVYPTLDRMRLSKQENMTVNEILLR